MARNKPSITTKCPANSYAGRGETIAEFSFPDGSGGLISLRMLADGSPAVSVYRRDPSVAVFWKGSASCATRG